MKIKTYRLNREGKAEIAAWVYRNAKKDHDVSAWFGECEDCAQATRDGWQMILEMRSFDSLSGNPETLTLQPEWFDVEETEEEEESPSPFDQRGQTVQNQTNISGDHRA